MHKKILLKYSAIFIFLGMMMLVSTSKNIEAKKERSLFTLTKMMIDVDKGADAFEVPADVSITQLPIDVPTGFLQNIDEKKPNLMKNPTENLKAYGSKADDFIMDVKQLPDDTFLLVVASRGASIQTANVFRTNAQGNILAQQLISKQATYNPSFAGDSKADGSFVGSLSAIVDLGNGNYVINYVGQRPGDLLSASRSFKFTAQPNNGGKIENSSWGNVSIDPNHQLGSEQNLANGIWLLGSDQKRMVKTGYILVNEGDRIGMLEYIPSTNSFGNKKLFEFPEYYSYYTPLYPGHGVWLQDKYTQAVVGIDTNNDYYGLLRYSTYTRNLEEFRMLIGFWDQTTGDLKSKIEFNKNEKVTFLKNITTNKALYYTVTGSTATTLYKVDLTKPLNARQAEKMIDYPAGTVVQISPSNNSIAPFLFFGFIKNPIGEFNRYNIKANSIAYAFLDDDFKVVIAAGLDDSIANVKDDSLTFFDVQANIMTGGGFFVSGTTDNRSFTDAPVGGWQTKFPPSSGTASLKDIFFGQLFMVDDYPPGIRCTGNLPIINIDNPSINWDQELLAGVEVTDNFDLNPLRGGKTQQWLNNRLNRNPNDPNFENVTDPHRFPIDWKGLGLDKTNRGPQEIKYFVTDSAKQTTATSRFINNIDDETSMSSDDHYALAASNFSIHVNDLATLDKDGVKKLTKMLAWNTKDATIIDSGGNIKNIVEVNTTQLQNITDVKAAYDALKNIDPKEKAKLIKPYPLTLEFTTADGEVVERTTTVFITDDTTTIDHHVVIYGFDFEESIKRVKHITSTEVITASEASTWNFKMDWLKDNQALPIENLTVDLIHSATPNENETGLNLVTKVGDYKVKFNYDDGEGTTATNHQPTAYIGGNLALLHIRQVLLDVNDELVVPTQSYLTWQNINKAATPIMAQEMNTKHPIIKDDSDQTFNKIQLELAFEHWQYVIQPIIPEYYQYEGYIAKTAQAISGTSTAHKAADRTTSAMQNRPILDFSTEEEYWVTIYLKPISVLTIRPYSWDYQAQNLGNLTP